MKKFNPALKKIFSKTSQTTKQEIYQIPIEMAKFVVKFCQKRIPSEEIEKGIAKTFVEGNNPISKQIKNQIISNYTEEVNNILHQNPKRKTQTYIKFRTNGLTRKNIKVIKEQVSLIYIICTPVTKNTFIIFL